MLSPHEDCCSFRVMSWGLYFLKLLNSAIDFYMHLRMKRHTLIIL